MKPVRWQKSLAEIIGLASAKQFCRDALPRPRARVRAWEHVPVGMKVDFRRWR